MNDYLKALLANDLDLEKSQSSLLFSALLKPNAQTEFGLQHSFDQINSLDDYRRLVPLSDYEGFRAWVEKVANGEQAILSQARTSSFFKTSGSLSKPKLIPVTADLMRQKVGVFAAYWESIYDAYPRIRDGKLVSNFSDASEPEVLPSGLQVFSESGFWAKRGRSLNSLERWPLPAEVRQVKDPVVRAYASARLLLQSELNCIMCLNPSTLLFFCRTMESYWSEIVDGLFTGGWGGEHNRTLSVLAADEHVSLSKHLQTRPEIALRLQGINKDSGRFALKELWPELDLVICWHSQVVQPYFEQLSTYIRDIPTRDYITQSSECMMAVPIGDFRSGGLLAHTAHFFEFIPESDVNNSVPTTRFAWQLEKGHRYELVVTTGGGLYRYRMGDCIQVNDFHGAVPVVEFLYRLGRTSSITGEKLTEFQVLRAAAFSTESLRFSPDEFLCFPCGGHQPHYAVALEGSIKDITDEQLLDWVSSFDDQLKKINSEYEDKRNSGRLGEMSVFRSDVGRLRESRMLARAPGVSEEQVKSEVLSAKVDLHLHGLTIKQIR
ncbi:MAG: GH3 auxin-responsive promoter family protein [Granulosicoccus sp.]